MKAPVSNEAGIGNHGGHYKEEYDKIKEILKDVFRAIRPSRLLILYRILEVKTKN